MAAPHLSSWPLPAPNPDLDYLLGQVGMVLQLTPEQYRLAAQHYAAVGDWLAAPESPLARYRPWIYPQGSMALETTVRPRSRAEYDLDLVCQMLRTGMPALWVYNAVYERLMRHERYAPMVEKKNRCLRLNYAHDFHLDIIPAEPDDLVGGEAIRVPDRELRDWSPSNPRGYVAWFTHRSKLTLAELRKKLDPLPRPTPADKKPALTIAVQLIKRRRDMLCAEDVAPCSIVLTTLAAEHYRGSDSVVAAMVEIVAGIQERIRAARPGRITVCNPTNGGERFCESFDGPGRYAAFTCFVDQLERDIAEIAATQGMLELQEFLGAKFGAQPAARALKSYGELLKARRDTGTLGFSSAAGLSIITGATPGGSTRTVPANRYFGGDSHRQHDHGSRRGE